MLPWIGRSLIVLLTLALTILIKSNMEPGIIAFALATSVSIILSEINDGLITIVILTLLVGNIIASILLDEKFILPWSNVAIIIATAILIELLFSTTQETAFLDFFILISTILIITLSPHFLMPQPILSSEQPVVTASVANIKPHKLVKPVVKTVVKPVIKSITKVTKPETKPLLKATTKIINIPVTVLPAVEIKPDSTPLQQGTTQRLFSIAAMVAVYLIIL